MADGTAAERQQRFRRAQVAAGRSEWRVWLTEREKVALADALAAMRAGRSEPAKVPPAIPRPLAVSFPGKPSQAVRDELRRAGLRWEGGAWVGTADPSAVAQIAVPAGGRVDLA